MLTIHCSPTYKPEREYICNVLLKDFLGVEYHIQYSDRNDWCLQGENGASCVLPDILFHTPEEKWLTPDSLPQQPLKLWNSRTDGIECNLVDEHLPVMYGNLDYARADDLHGFNASTISIPLDIFGSAFFMLSRYEELVKKNRDKHGRFPVWASLAFQEGFLERPIVNEYLEILWSVLQTIWPGLVRKARQARILVSCDVDTPYLCHSKSLKTALLVAVADILKRKSITKALNTCRLYLRARGGNYNYNSDPYFNALKWIMDINEKVGNQVAFYFIPEQLHSKFDGCYSLDEPVIRHLLHNIHARGHEIGLHASYTSYDNEQQLGHEREILQQVLDEEGIRQQVAGGRQHYLRWKNPHTARNWEAAGLLYDSTLSYADYAGFRCGVCYEYQMYDCTTRKPLRLQERPLVLMESSVIDSVYMGLGYSDNALNYMEKIRQRCVQFQGDFTLLWHNSHLRNAEDLVLYERLVCGRNYP